MLTTSSTVPQDGIGCVERYRHDRHKWHPRICVRDASTWPESLANRSPLQYSCNYSTTGSLIMTLFLQQSTDQRFLKLWWMNVLPLNHPLHWQQEPIQMTICPEIRIITVIFGFWHFKWAPRQAWQADDPGCLPTHSLFSISLSALRKFI